MSISRHGYQVHPSCGTTPITICGPKNRDFFALLRERPPFAQQTCADAKEKHLVSEGRWNIRIPWWDVPSSMPWNLELLSCLHSLLTSTWLFGRKMNPNLEISKFGVVLCPIKMIMLRTKDSIFHESQLRNHSITPSITILPFLFSHTKGCVPREAWRCWRTPRYARPESLRKEER